MVFVSASIVHAYSVCVWLLAHALKAIHETFPLSSLHLFTLAFLSGLSCLSFLFLLFYRAAYGRLSVAITADFHCLTLSPICYLKCFASVLLQPVFCRLGHPLFFPIFSSTFSLSSPNYFSYFSEGSWYLLWLPIFLLAFCHFSFSFEGMIL